MHKQRRRDKAEGLIRAPLRFAEAVAARELIRAPRAPLRALRHGVSRSQGRNKSGPYGSYLALLTLLVLLLAACGGSSSASIPDAHQLISKAQTAIKAVTAYHFKLTTDHPGTGATLTILQAEGDIAVPDKLKANATALVLGSNAQVQIIAIGNQQYITDPITQQWHATTGLINPRTLSDPQTGVAAILGHIQNPTTSSDTNVTVNSTPCWNVNGKLDPTYLSGITGGGAPAGSLDSITTCIGKSDNLPYLIRITGIAAAGDTTATVRTFTLSKFGENISITPPPLGLTTPYIA